MTFRTGEHIAWRCRVRDVEGHDEVAFVMAVRVISDTRDEVDLMSPLRRTTAGYDFVENGLDIVVEPDMRTWKWKDEDELAYAVDEGAYTRAEADALYAEGERAVERLRRERARFERWAAWRPDPAWPPAALPAGWDEP